jgi:spore maturation protein CgeB
MKILCIGSQWRGANDNAIFKSLSKLGHLIEVIDEHYYINLLNTTKYGKILSFVSRNLNDINEFNKKIKLQFNSFEPDLVFIYKGQWVHPDTIVYIKNRGCKVVNFYPDVSFTAHGKFIPKCLPLYDLVFSTKSFAVDDAKKLFNYSKVEFVPHGFDPDIHRPFPIVNAPSEFFCDASFIGTYSISKEEFLKFLKKSIPKLKLNIWGSGWHNADPVLRNCIMKSSVTGDLYSLAIQCSKVNLALLSERVRGASNGDQITSRTFHITGAGGFMLHKKTKEVLDYYDENYEIGCFEGKEDLVKKVELYLMNSELRESIRIKGFEKAVAFHTYLSRVNQILEKLNEKKII